MKLFSRKSIFISLFLMIVLSLNSTPKIASADPGAVNDFHYWQEGFVAIQNNTLEMTDANVIMNIEIEENRKKVIGEPTVKIEFYGKYTIYTLMKQLN
jgi:hypothetical protein